MRADGDRRLLRQTNWDEAAASRCLAPTTHLCCSRWRGGAAAAAAAASPTDAFSTVADSGHCLLSIWSKTYSDATPCASCRHLLALVATRILGLHVDELQFVVAFLESGGWEEAPIAAQHCTWAALVPGARLQLSCPQLCCRCRRSVRDPPTLSHPLHTVIKSSINHQSFTVDEVEWVWKAESKIMNKIKQNENKNENN